MYYYDKALGYSVEDMINEYVTFKKNTDQNIPDLDGSNEIVYNKAEYDNSQPLHLIAEDDETIEYEINYLKHLHNEIPKKMHPFIEQTVDEMDYEGSPIYDKQIPKEILRHLIDRAYQKIVYGIKELTDMQNISKQESIGYWGKEELGRSLVHSLLLREMFDRRRRKHRHHRRKYDHHHDRRHY